MDLMAAIDSKWPDVIIAVMIALTTVYTKWSADQRERRIAEEKRAADAISNAATEKVAAKVDQNTLVTVAAAEKVAVKVDGQSAETVSRLDIIHKLANDQLTKAIDGRAAAEARSKVLLDLLKSMAPDDVAVKALVLSMTTETAAPTPPQPKLPIGGEGDPSAVPNGPLPPSPRSFHD